MFDEAAREYERALAINPRDAFAYLHLGLARYLAGDWEAAHDISLEAWRRTPSGWAGYQLALVHLQRGDLGEAARLSAEGARRFPGDVLLLSLDGVIAALRGDAAAADRQIDEVVRHRRAFGHYHHAQYDVACIHAQLGRVDQGVAWLRDAAANGFPCAAFFARDRLLAPLHAAPAFQTLLGELAEENAHYRRVYYESRQSA